MSFYSSLFVLLLLVSFPVEADYDQAKFNKYAIKAIIDGDVIVVKSLIDKGFDPNYKIGLPRNAMRMAAFLDRSDILRHLFEAGGNADHKLQEGMYFVNFAAQRDEGIFKMVIDQGVDLDRLMYFDQFTAFTALMRVIDLDLLRYVLDNSVFDINFIPPNGYSALYRFYIINECGLGCLKLLLDSCADPFIPVKSGHDSFESYMIDRGDSEALFLIENQDC